MKPVIITITIWRHSSGYLITLFTAISLPTYPLALRISKQNGACKITNICVTFYTPKCQHHCALKKFLIRETSECQCQTGYFSVKSSWTSWNKCTRLKKHKIIWKFTDFEPDTPNNKLPN